MYISVSAVLRSESTVETRAGEEELIAAEPTEQITVSYCAVCASSDLDEQLVSGVVAVRVID